MLKILSNHATLTLLRLSEDKTKTLIKLKVCLKATEVKLIQISSQNINKTPQFQILLKMVFSLSFYFVIQIPAPLTFTCSKSTTETLEKSVKYVQS